MRRRTKTTMQPICAVCKEDMSYDVVRKSLSWYQGIKGVRMMLCSIPCRDQWDTDHAQS